MSVDHILFCSNEAKTYSAGTDQIQKDLGMIYKASSASYVGGVVAGRVFVSVGLNY